MSLKVSHFPFLSFYFHLLIEGTRKKRFNSDLMNILDDKDHSSITDYTSDLVNKPIISYEFLSKHNRMKVPKSRILFKHVLTSDNTQRRHLVNLTLFDEITS